MSSFLRQWSQKCIQDIQDVLHFTSKHFLARMGALERDVTEGADFLVVKPGLAYLNIVQRVKDRFSNHCTFHSSR